MKGLVELEHKSLGLIETIGLTAAIEAADTAVKSANVQLVGYELTKGGGMTVVKVEGDVGAVKAAIEAARVAALKVNQVVSVKVIARPAKDIEGLIRNADTVGYDPPKDAVPHNLGQPPLVKTELKATVENPEALLAPTTKVKTPKVRAGEKTAPAPKKNADISGDKDNSTS